MFDKLPSLRGFQPKFYSGGATRFHLPLFYDLVAEAKPKRVVTLGFSDGQAFFTFCQAANEQKIDCQCIAVRRDRSGESEEDDIAWNEGREDGEEFYGERARFFATKGSALAEVANGSIDILFLDDSDSGKEIREDLPAWEAKLAPEAIVLLYGLCLEREDSPKVAWDEWVADRPHAIFSDGLGLGIALKSKTAPTSFLLQQLFGRSSKVGEIAEAYALAVARIDAQDRVRQSEQAGAALELRQVWLDSLLADRWKVQEVMDSQARAIGDWEERFQALLKDRTEAQLVIDSLAEQVQQFDALRRDRAKAQLIMDSQHEQLRQWLADNDR